MAKKAAAKPANALNKPIKVTAEFAAVIGKDETTRPEATKLLWDYIKKHDLQDKKDKRVINPDATLAAVIGKDPVNMMKMTSLVNKHFIK